MKIVEMLGLPGSGKTTYYEKISNKLKASGFNCYSANDVKVLYALQNFKILNYLPQNGYLFKKAIKKIYKYKKIKSRILLECSSNKNKSYSLITELIQNSKLESDEKKDILKLFQETIFIYELAKRTLKDDDCLFIDEGYFHRLSTMFVSKDILIDIKHLEQTLYFYGTPEKVLYLNVDIDFAYNNILNRERGLPARMNKYSLNEQKTHLDNINKLQTYIIDNCQQNNLNVEVFNKL